MEDTKVIEMELTDLDDMSLTTIVNSPELTRQVQIRSLAKHGRTMIMMYKATGYKKYLSQARRDYHMAQSLLRGGFMRPLGVIFDEVA